jgi:hypothetical protein
VSLRTRGVVASRAVPALTVLAGMAVLAGLGVTGCTSGDSAVPVDAPSLPERAATTCREFLADVPDTLAEQPSRPVTPQDAPAAAWGDPAIVLTCGAEVPREFDEFSSCIQASGVGWFVPESQQEDQSADVTWTAVGHRPVVQVQVPADYRPEGAAAVIAELAADVRHHLRLVRRCR